MKKRYLTKKVSRHKTNTIQSNKNQFFKVVKAKLTPSGHTVPPLLIFDYFYEDKGGSEGARAPRMVRKEVWIEPSRVRAPCSG